tara:strand:+ start:1918 stop:2583 length:666 start_codon:yes stop_codon:yes gene_type:complete
MNQFISYEGLPINSGGAHSVSRKSQKVTYEQTLDFLNFFADKTLPKSIDLTLYESEKKEYSALKLLPKLTLKFGIPKTRNDGWLRTWTWSLTEKDIENGFETLELNNELPKNPAGPISLNFNWNFHFKDPKTNQILPNQELIPELDFRIKNSRIYLMLSKKSTISVWFALPFEKMEKYELEFIKELKSNLPFKTSDKHWRTWKKSEKGNWTPRKIEIKNVS